MKHRRFPKLDERVILANDKRVLRIEHVAPSYNIVGMRESRKGHDIVATIEIEKLQYDKVADLWRQIEENEE